MRILRWFLKLLAGCFKLARKQLCDTPALKQSPPTSSAFSCTACKAALDTIHRFKDRSDCKLCHPDIDSEGSTNDTDGAFSD